MDRSIELLADKLLDALEALVNAPGAFADKRDAIQSLAKAGNCDGLLEEFLSWFDA